MKKTYVKPQIQWIPIRPEQPVANPCWAYAGKGPLYHDVPGEGYVEILLTKGGCGKAKIVTVTVQGVANLTDKRREEIESWFSAHLAQKMAESGNNMAPLKVVSSLKDPTPPGVNYG